MVAVSKEIRFEFGQNWQSFLHAVDERHIAEARRSLQDKLRCQDLQGLSFLDAGCGSGLFSLAARQLGARVTSFDYDPQAVSCAQTLRHRFESCNDRWRVTQGSVLDRDFVQSLGSFDIVYSWGVLHHTGQLWQAMESVLLPLAANGRLFIALYNDQGLLSKLWGSAKKTYCRGRLGKAAAIGAVFPYFAVRSAVAGLVRFQHPLGQFKHYQKNRGMSLYHDWHDWLGGYPFEVAAPGQVLDFYRQRGLDLVHLETTNSWGCNEFVFCRGGRPE